MSERAQRPTAQAEYQRAQKSEMSRMAEVVGIDARPKGWVAVGIGTGDTVVATASDLSELVDRFSGAAVIGIDMPIGFAASKRACDVEARAFVGPRRNSVFMTPPQDVLYAPTYPEANALSRTDHGAGISRQAYALAINVRRVAEVARDDARLIEVHPEVSFRAMLGQHLDYAKTTWNGQHIRRQALRDVGIEIPEMLDEAGGVPPADVLDAAVAAWSAQRYAHGRAESLPRDAHPGDRPTIWY